MEYNEENCIVSLEKNIVSFKGRIETADYSRFSSFLLDVDKNVEENSIVYDLRSLTFLNSSGIKTIAVHLLKSIKKYRIKINPDLTWQKVGIIPLRLIRPKGEIIIE